MAKNNDGAGNPKKGMLETSSGYARRRAGETGAYMERKGGVPPSNKVDTQGRPVNPNRTAYGYRGHDPAREPMKDTVRDRRQAAGLPSAQQVRDQNKVNPDQVKARAMAAAPAKAKPVATKATAPGKKRT